MCQELCSHPCIYHLIKIFLANRNHVILDHHNSQDHRIQSFSLFFRESSDLISICIRFNCLNPIQVILIELGLKKYCVFMWQWNSWTWEKIKKTIVKEFYERNANKKDSYITTLDNNDLWVDSKINGS
ncbi:unnamed protein product [Rhizophagus irregularis]|nr:unnamed protein product [Rhizophagus irregularis]